jgi:hypothetical protein
MPRHSISESQRKALRKWYNQQYPQPRQKDCVEWFRNKFNHQISQSTVSESLSNHFQYLDQDPQIPIKESFRQRAAQWPILESILYDWHLIIENQGGFTSGDIIIEKAKEIWPQIPQYSDLPLPEFSQGWLTGFKQRHQIQQRIQHGEAGSISNSISSLILDEMKAIRTLCGEYPEDCIYNMDKTGLFWQRAPSSGLTSQN